MTPKATHLASYRRGYLLSAGRETLTIFLETFTGFVDEAVVVCSTSGTRWLFLEGWILAREGPITQLAFKITESSSQTIATRIERPDVARQQPHILHAKHSGFRVSLPLDAMQSASRVEFCAQLETGSVIRSAIDVRPTLSRPVYQYAASVYEQGISNSSKKREKDFLPPDYRRDFITVCKQRYRNFMSTGERISLPRQQAATLSVIIPVAGHDHLTYACLENLCALGTPGLEVIVIDSADSAETRELIKRFSGIKRVANRGKNTFGHACNLGAEKAKGRNLLFLNNDAFPLPGALEAALSCLKQNPDSGAVGAKIVRPDGRIQEVGAFILPTGTTVGRGRGTPPDEPAFNIPVRVDYCSAAFLLTPKQIFTSFGGFDERFDPAYYEDTDYCLRVAKAGHPCVVEPHAVVLHLERGTTDDTYDIASLMAQNLEVFKSLHPEFDQQHTRENPSEQLMQHRSEQHTATAPFSPPSALNQSTATRQSILVIDDAIPDPVQGQGQGRSALILETLANLDLEVSWYPVYDKSEDMPIKAPRNVAFVKPEKGRDRIDFLRHLLSSVDTVLVSRSHHMEEVQLALRSLPALRKVPRIVYDAECLQGTREILRFEFIYNLTLSNEEIETILSNEVVLARDADQILAASDLEATTFVDFGFSAPTIVSHGVTPRPTNTSFDERSHLLSVGPMLGVDTPNSDAILWFMQSIFPRIISLLHTSRVALHCVGDCRVDEIISMQGVSFKLLGQIRDMLPVYSRYRIMVAPTRFVAGIPLKVIEAAAYGVPCVVTPPLAQQLGWQDDVELLVGYDPIDFAAKCAALYQDARLWQRIRDAALHRVTQQFSVTEFQNRLSSAISASQITSKGT